MNEPIFILHPSQNCDERTTKPSFIVIHYTDTKDLRETFDIFDDPKNQVSCHVVIDEDGKFYRLIDDDKTAWHAGKSFWNGIRNLNPFSLGVELQNGGLRYGKKLSPDITEPPDFPKTQISSLLDLIIWWRKKYDIPITNIIGHSDCAPNRKFDPGKKFPWQILVEQNLAVNFPDISHFSPTEQREELLALGYDPEISTDILLKAYDLRCRK